MKKILIVFITMVFAIKSMAQTSETTVSGSVVDTKDTPVESATISLMNAMDSSVTKLNVSDKAGNFLFSAVPYGNYFITISSVNFETGNSPFFSLSEKNISVRLDTVVLQSIAKKLATVVINAQKPLVEQKIDRMIVNVDASVTNVGSTALEVLEKSPGVSVDKDGNIALKGKPNVTIMIDGKPSYLSGAELANLLSNMNSNQLSQIEIMTNPSAKYDAAGNAGVINIKTKKNTAQGLNGNVTLNYGQGVYPKINNSILLNYRTGKFNAFLNYGYILNKSFVNVDVVRNFMNSTGNKSYELDQSTYLINQSQNNNLKFGLDYFINPTTTIGFAATGFMAPQNQTALTTSYIKDSISNVTSIEKTNKTVDNTWKNGTLNINFNTTFDNDKKNLTGNFDYLHYNFSGNQYVNGSTYDASQQLQSNYYLTNLLPLNIDVYAARLDYTQSLSNGLK